MRILLTGLSSFTGVWIGRALAAAGHEVVAPLRGCLDAYEPARAQRVAWAGEKVRLVESCPFGSDAFLALLREGAPFDLLCHHAADVTNYRSPDFDTAAALANNVTGLRAVLDVLKHRSPHAPVLYTGSVFENDEGLGDVPLRAFSPYGLSKGLTWQFLRYYCGAASVRLGKFVIPNPFGPHEEPRFTAYLIRTWKSGKGASVQTPAYVRDNIHVDLLALAYARYAEALAKGSEPLSRCSPSGYVESQGAFARRFAAEMRGRLGLACELDLLVQKDFPEPLVRVNSEPAARGFPEWNETAAWDAVATFYR